MFLFSKILWLNIFTVICIFSNSGDYSTTDVIRWLHHLGEKDVLRINYNDTGSNDPVRIDMAGNTLSFQTGGRTVHLKEIESVWYRKGTNWLCDDLFYAVTVEHHANFTAYLNNKLKNEETKLAEYLHYIIQHNAPTVLGNAGKSDLNKLLVLHMARETGLLIPDFYVTNYKQSIHDLFKQSTGLITKSLSDGLYLFEKSETNTGYFTYTEAVEEAHIEQLPEVLSPSLLQKNIHKKFELRVFFMDERCYSMAIFSQTDEKTRTDFRKYNEEKPNRFVPFMLPADIDGKLKLLFHKLNLNTGSVDLIVDTKGDFYFLEINPVGQFGMVSQPCNYHLEKKIALYLMNHEKRKRAN